MILIVWAIKTVLLEFRFVKSTVLAVINEQIGFELNPIPTIEAQLDDEKEGVTVEGNVINIIPVLDNGSP